jgi:hypothetical protein
MAAGNMVEGRFGHTGTLLLGGKVLVAGGNSGYGLALSSAELYEPARDGGVGSFTATWGMTAARNNHSATRLPDGRVLIVGGYDFYGPKETAEVFDPAGYGGSGSFTATGSLVEGRMDHTATLLPGGKVLIAGGTSNAGFRLTAEVYDPAGDGGAGSFTVQGSLAEGRRFHTATPLPDGRVLIAGGQNGLGEPLASAEVYDPDGDGGAGSFTATGNMARGRSSHTATLLRDGKVLIAGGTGSGTIAFSLASAEVYDPAGNGGAGSFTATGSLVSPRDTHTATQLADGKVLIAGGNAVLMAGPSYGGILATAELYDPAGDGGVGSFSATPSMSSPRVGLTATLLPDGRVLIAGGRTSSSYLWSAELAVP